MGLDYYDTESYLSAIDSIFLSCNRIREYFERLQNTLFWFNDHLRKLKNKKYRVSRKYKRSGLCVDLVKYLAVGRDFSSLKSECYVNYRNRMKNKILTDSNILSKFVDSRPKIMGYALVVGYDCSEAS